MQLRHILPQVQVLRAYCGKLKHKALKLSVISSGVTPSAQASTWAPLIITSGQAAKPCPASDGHPIHHHHHHHHHQHHCLLHQNFHFHHKFFDSSSSPSRSTVVKPRHWIDKSSHLPDIWVCCLKVLDDDENGDDENGDDDDNCDDVGYFVFKSLMRKSCSWIFNDVV